MEHSQFEASDMLLFLLELTCSVKVALRAKWRGGTVLVFKRLDSRRLTSFLYLLRVIVAM